VKSISLAGIGTRFVIALFLVLVTWNPTGLSYLEWALNNWSIYPPLVVFFGLVLIVCWVIFLRATIRSLGPVGLTLAAALSGSIVWLVVYYGLVELSNRTAMAWILLLLLAVILAAGMSWSHLRRRWAGQADVDDLDDDS